MNYRNIIEVAKHMAVHHGSQTASLMEERARQNAAAGDTEAASFWAQVARTVRLIQMEGERR